VWLEDNLPRINPNAKRPNTAIHTTPQFRSSDFLCERHNQTLGGVGEGEKSLHLDRD
jgi:hypothetical protein